MNTFMQVAGWTLIHFVWQGAAIGLVVAAALKVTKRRSPNVCYIIACVGLTAMLAAPVATVRLLRVTTSAPAVDTADLTGLPSTAAHADSGVAKRFWRFGEPGRSVSGGWAARSVSAPFTAIAGGVDGAQIDRFVNGVTMAWLLGVVLLLGRMGGGWWHVRRLHRIALATHASRWQTACRRIAFRLGLPAAAHVVESTLIEVPTVVGWLR